ncbi:hypothetical protein [Chlamydia vaughanii]
MCCPCSRSSSQPPANQGSVEAIPLEENPGGGGVRLLQKQFHSLYY